MFGPNTYFKDTVSIHSSHRDQSFFKLFDQVRELFAVKFGLEDYDILFIPGSATVGVEATMFSMKYRIKMAGYEGEFKNRWNQMLQNYPKKESYPETEMYCRLETSISAPFSKENCIVDAVSAFPYYDLPKGTKVMCSCLNKQLASYVGLAVVCVKKDQWEHCVDSDVYSYLNLRRYKDYADRHQTPNTSPTFIYEHFCRVLKSFDLEQFRDRINKVSDLICSAIPEEYIIGDRRCPVITIKKEAFEKNQAIAEKFDLYGYWTGKPDYQIFTYTSPVEDYKEFVRQYRSSC